MRSAYGAPRLVLYVKHAQSTNDEVSFQEVDQTTLLAPQLAVAIRAPTEINVKECESYSIEICRKKRDESNLCLGRARLDPSACVIVLCAGLLSSGSLVQLQILEMYTYLKVMIHKQR